jgi:iron complex outermembrane receptor protein
VLNDLELVLEYHSNKVPWFTRDFHFLILLFLMSALYYKPERSNMQIAINAGNLFNKTYWLVNKLFAFVPGAPKRNA